MVGYWMEKEWVPGYKILGEPNNGEWKAKIQVKLDNLENYVKTTSKNQMEIEPKEDKYIFGPLKIKAFRSSFENLVEADVYEDYRLPSYIKDDYGRLYSFDSSNIKSSSDLFCEATYKEVFSFMLHRNFNDVINLQEGYAGILSGICPSLPMVLNRILIKDKEGNLLNVNSWEDLAALKFSVVYDLFPNAAPEIISVSLIGTDEDSVDFMDMECNLCSSKQVNRDAYDITLAKSGASYEAKLSLYLRVIKGDRTYRIMKYEFDNKKNQYKLRLMSS